MDKLRAVDVLGQDWVVAVMLVVLGIAAWVNLAAPRQWAVLRRAFFAMRLGKQALRDDLSLRDRSLVALLAMAVVPIGLFAYQVAVMHGWAAPDILLFGRVLLLVILVLVARILLMRGLSVLAGTDGGASECVYTLVAFTIVLGIALLPVSILMAWPWQVAWRTWLWPLGAAVCAAVLLFRWSRTVVIGLGNAVPLRYIFIYLCAAEILPVALAVHELRLFLLPPSHPT